MAAEMDLAAMLGVTPEAPPASATEDPPPPVEDAPGEPAEPPADQEPPPPVEPVKWSLDRIQSTTEWTPETIASAGEWLHAEERRNQRVFAASRKQAAKAQQRMTRLDEERRGWEVTRSTLIADAQALRNGTPEQRLQALARVTGQSPEDVIEGLTVGVAAPGKRPAEAQLDRATRERIDRLERMLQDREQATQQQTAVATVQSQLARGVADADRFPALAARAAEMGPDVVAGKLLEYMQVRAKAGQYLTTSDMLALADQAEARSSTPPRVAARETARTLEAPGQPARGRPARVESPQMADQPATARKKTPDAYASDLARMLLGGKG